MGTFCEVFERKEVKYRLSAFQRDAILRALGGRMAIDEYGVTRIMSLYLDTPQRALIERSLEKPVYKEKLRLRSYGMPAEQDRVFVEIKKKFKGIVYKRRVGLSYAAARLYLKGVSFERACARYPLPDAVMAAESLAPRSIQIAREIDRFRELHGPLRSSMLIVCERSAYAEPVLADRGQQAKAKDHSDAESSVTSGLRVTFDENIAYRDLMAVSASSERLKPLLTPGETIMEIKSAGPFPRWLVRALDECRAYPSSFSKYGEAYRNCVHPRAVRSPGLVVPVRATAHAAHGRTENSSLRALTA